MQILNKTRKRWRKSALRKRRVLNDQTKNYIIFGKNIVGGTK